MSNTISPNMSLVIPGIGSESGPTYAFDVNASLTIIDRHDHSANSGVRINPSGLNINSALAINNNFLNTIAGLTLVAQNSTPAINTIYESGVDLYYVDGLGNNIQITANGGIAGSPGSISNLTSPASASYVSGSSTFVWQSGASIAANMDFGSAIMRNLSPNSTFALTLQPPANLVSNFSITLPTIPANLSLVTIDNAGVLSGSIALSGGTIPGSAITSGSITSTQIASRTILASNILLGTITTAEISPAAGITGGQIATTTITATNIVNNTITGAQIQSSANFPGNGTAVNGQTIITSGGAVNPGLKIIRGLVQSNGTVTSGEEFSVVHTSTGVYTITFNTGFASAPACLLTADGGPGIIGTINISTSSFQATSGTSGSDFAFSFLAIGVRT